MSKFYLLSPEKADDCGGVIKPNETYEVVSIDKSLPSTFIEFNIPDWEDNPCLEQLEKAWHLRNGARWLLLERLD